MRPIERRLNRLEALNPCSGEPVVIISVIFETNEPAHAVWLCGSIWPEPGETLEDFEVRAIKAARTLPD